MTLRYTEHPLTSLSAEAVDNVDLVQEKIRNLLLSEPNGFSFFINSDLNMIGKFIQSVKN
jgi:hypothetical protein